MPTDTSPVLLSRFQINDEQWNAVIGQSLQYVLYANSWYLDIVCESWQAIVWPRENYQVVMPLPITRRWGLTVLQQPLFCQHLGVFSLSELTRELLKSFLELLDKSFSYVSNYHFNPGNQLMPDEVLPDCSKLKIQIKYTFWLSLNGSYQKIYQGYSSDRRRNLKAAVHVEKEIFQGVDVNHLLNLFRENHAMQIPGGVDETSFSKFSRLFEKLGKKAESEIWYHEQDGTVSAGIFIVKNAGHAVYLFNAADPKGRKSNARTYMLDQYFVRHAGEATVFDFESPEMSSIASFYKSFGSEKMAYCSIIKNDLPFPLRIIQKWRKRYLLNRQNQVKSLRSPL